MKCPVVANTVAELGEIQFPLMLIIGNTFLKPLWDTREQLDWKRELMMWNRPYEGSFTIAG